MSSKYDPTHPEDEAILLESVLAVALRRFDRMAYQPGQFLHDGKSLTIGPAGIRRRPPPPPPPPVPVADLADFDAVNQWQDRAACTGAGHLFFPPPIEQAANRRDRVLRAQAICRTCPVARQCREAGQTEPWGVWGGVDVLGASNTPGGAAPFTPLPEEHGSERGYRQHLARGEIGDRICDPCRDVHNATLSRRRGTMRTSVA